VFFGISGFFLEVIVFWSNVKIIFRQTKAIIIPL